MIAPSESEIRAQLARLLDQQLTFEDFWEWLHPLQLVAGSNSPERRLLYTIIGRFEEYDAGMWTDEQMMAMLTALTGRAESNAARAAVQPLSARA